MRAPDPRLVILFRIFARQVAQKFIQAAWDDQERIALQSEPRRPVPFAENEFAEWFT
jgi:hypothetical protein